MVLRQVLATLLLSIQRHDLEANYGARNDTIYQALAMARLLDYSAGIRLDPEEPEWPVIYIELPTGQVSWHVAQHEHPWDTHTTADKYGRIADWLRG